MDGCATRREGTSPTRRRWGEELRAAGEAKCVGGGGATADCGGVACGRRRTMPSQGSSTRAAATVAADDVDVDLGILGGGMNYIR
uniref:Uncharacterized protein n=1 Tax=Oryza barthii TaxID=65489 RepID=A0A0D3HLY6_9ORYZ